MLPRENLYRACMPGAELRAASGTDEMPTMTGHFSVFDTPTEINSRYEGRFIERIARGAFAKTIQENRGQIKVMFNHGRDPQIGEKPLGPLDELREDEIGGRYSVPLLDAHYVRELVPALKAGLLGASFRFEVIREKLVDNPKRSAANPDGIPERLITEARLYELGPVVNPAYASATAGIRSLTDEIRDIDAVIAATPILLDEERTERARVFLSRSIPDLSELSTTPEDRSDAACECAGECACADCPATERDESNDAPSTDSADPPSEAAHPVAERRVPTDKPVYGTHKKEPSWRL